MFIESLALKPISWLTDIVLHGIWNPMPLQLLMFELSLKAAREPLLQHAAGMFMQHSRCIQTAWKNGLLLRASR